ncbi:isocitrate lyase/PEP mutase family protein [Segnochrobactraceae bacterium EtOH-i3]
MNQHVTLPADPAARFHQLHRDFFVLPTVWDTLSGLAAVAAGYPAVATSSAALGFAKGILSSERVPFDVVEAQLRLIADSLPVPVSIDMEDGYPEVPGGVAESITRIIGAGVIAANIEDSWHGHARPLASADDHARRIATIRAAADRARPGFFVNARTDLFLQGPGVEPEVSVAEAIRRANLYVEAGADGIYVTGKALGDDQIAELAAGIRAPLTVGAPDGRPFGSWAGLGVKRASLGIHVIRNAFHAIRDQLRHIGTATEVPPLVDVDIDAAIRAGRARG